MKEITNKAPAEVPELKYPPVAMLIVNGGNDPEQGSWIELCLSRIVDYTRPEQYQLYLWNNNPPLSSFHDMARAYVPDVEIYYSSPGEVLSDFHAVPLQRMYEIAAKRGHEWIVTLDSDAHPVKEGWLEHLMEKATDKCVAAGVWRDELSDGIPPYIHPSGMCIRQDFLTTFGLRFDTSSNAKPGERVDTVSDFTRIAISKGLAVYPMSRSNVRQVHKLIGGIYENYIYHHGAGSRAYFIFWGEEDTLYRRKLNTVIARVTAGLLMKRYHHYMNFLQGVGELSLASLAMLVWLQADKPTFTRTLVIDLVLNYQKLQKHSRKLLARIRSRA